MASGDHEQRTGQAASVTSGDVGRRVEPRVALQSGKLQVAWPGFAALSGLSLRCRLGDGSPVEVDRWLETPTASVFQARGGPIVASLRFRQQDGRLRLDACVRALKALELAELELAGSFRLEAADSGWVLQNGYQSGSDQQRRFPRMRSSRRAASALAPPSARRTHSACSGPSRRGSRRGR